MISFRTAAVESQQAALAFAVQAIQKQRHSLSNTVQTSIAQEFRNIRERFGR